MDIIRNSGGSNSEITVNISVLRSGTGLGKWSLGRVPLIMADEASVLNNLLLLKRLNICQRCENINIEIHYLTSSCQFHIPSKYLYV